MSEQITRTEVDSLIDRLKGTKEIKAQCSFCGKVSEFEHKDIMLGDVLEKLVDRGDMFEVVRLWELVGLPLNNSIQTIIEESGWKKRYCQQCDVEHRYGDHDTLKSPECNNLLVFINNLIK